MLGLLLIASPRLQPRRQAAVHRAQAQEMLSQALNALEASRAKYIVGALAAGAGRPRRRLGDNRRTSAARGALRWLVSSLDRALGTSGSE